ncbi:ATP/GTP-binding protein [Streptomyces sp. ISL-90]|nr:ATP/GTP-binding protein [Streptomyces sp. ISL-90]
MAEAEQKRSLADTPLWERTPPIRGWIGAGRGETVNVTVPTEFRGSTYQVCGLWPFAAGSGAPIIGAPLGRHLETGASICADPISWFYAGLINNPSLFEMALPALGKSTVSRRIVGASSGFGYIPFVLGDLKPDYVDLIRRLGGQVLTLGNGRGYINVLAPGDTDEAAQLITAAIERASAAGELVEAQLRAGVDEAGLQAITAALDEVTPLLTSSMLVDADEWYLADIEIRLSLLGAYITGTQSILDGLLEDAHARKTTMTATLISIQRQGTLADWEETILDRAVRILERDFEGVPVLGDLLELIQSAPDELRLLALDGGNLERYREITRMLEQSLIGLVHGGRLGQTFSRHTTAQQRRDSPVAYDVSAIKDSEPDLQGAVLMACWSAGFATINAAHALSDAGVEPARIYLVVMDELHRALRTGPGMVDRVDGLTRLNRNEGVGQIMITHTMKDLDSLPTEEDRAKARGLVERSGMLILGGLPPGEMPLLQRAITLSKKEQDRLASWTDPAPYDLKTGKRGTPPGRGKFLIKVGGSPGLPFQMELTAVEAGVHDTNKRWKTRSSIGRVRREEFA